MSYRFISFFSSSTRRVALPRFFSFPRPDFCGSLPLPLRLLTLPLLPLPCHSFRFAPFVVSRFVFAFGSSLERTDRALSHGGDSFIPVARKLPRKGERTPSRTSGELAGAQEIVLLILLRRGRDSCALCLPRFFILLARVFFFLFLSVCRVLLPR